MIARLLRYVPQPVVWRFAKRYIAGTSIQEAIEAVRRLNDQGTLATISYLGEHITDPRQCNEALEQYLILLVAIEHSDLRANVSVKPTQLGMNLDDWELWRAEFLVRQAAKGNIFVRFDMEDSSGTDRTLDLYCQLRRQYHNIGVVLQTRLRRSIADAERLAFARSNVRVCKGIYLEPNAIAYQRSHDIRQNFLIVLDLLLQAGCYVGIATHDEFLIKKSKRLIEFHETLRERFEFQMILGVRPELRKQLVREGYAVRVYVPYGRDWHAYSLRRLRENPEMAKTIARAVLLGK